MLTLYLVVLYSRELGLFYIFFALSRRRRLGQGPSLSFFFFLGGAVGCVMGVFTMLKKTGIDVLMLNEECRGRSSYRLRKKPPFVEAAGAGVLWLR